jgi:hypothetical protein
LTTGHRRTVRGNQCGQGVLFCAAAHSVVSFGLRGTQCAPLNVNTLIVS